MTDVTKERLWELLKLYGDHKFRCAITKVIRSDLRVGYPPCDCGWRAALDNELGRLQ